MTDKDKRIYEKAMKYTRMFRRGVITESELVTKMLHLESYDRRGYRLASCLKCNKTYETDIDTNRQLCPDCK